MVLRLVLIGIVGANVPCLANAVEPHTPARVAACMKSIDESVEIDHRLNPFYLRGDFDGDGRPDYAVLVKKGQDRGIVICRASSAKGVILGAGSAFNQMADMNFTSWDIYDKRPVEKGVGEGRPPKLLGDAIWVEWEESASALVYWTGHKFAWYQQGD